MKQNIQNRIDSIKALSTSMKLHNNNTAVNRNSEDSLSKSIRNKREADIFHNELASAIRRAKR